VRLNRQKKNRTVKTEYNIIEDISAKKNCPNKETEEYSIKGPAISSDSDSTKSKGALLVSAIALI